ncbi:MAG: BACON domain-containing protein [Bacteroidales bacterium]|nr:BACON domain-containing protein [Bacteroidales bacterium]
MRFKALLLSVMAGALMAAGCAQEDHQDMPYIDLDGISADAVLTFEAGASSQTFTLSSNRFWHIDYDAEWLHIEPSVGQATETPQVITVTVLNNDSFNRSAPIKVSMDYDYKTVTIKQKGEWGDPADMIIYKNNFDKEAATQTYGTGSSWPYTDQTDCWKNEEGSGIANVEYTATGMSVRNNSNSNGNYSDYSGSGMNNLFFGSKGAFKIANIDITGKNRNFELYFGSEKYLNQGSSVFNPDEFHVWIGSDPDHMVEVTYQFPDGSGYKDGRWDLAGTWFMVPEGTTTLCVYFKVDVASAYRLDDVELNMSRVEGTPLDFENGINPDKDPNAGKIIYFNNFDKEKATQTYGSGNSWPYTDQTDCWINHEGEGAANVTYWYKSISVRANSASDGSYSDYSGSGMNNLFFGSNGMFKIKGIATLSEYANYKISFGSEKYLNSGSSLFNPQEFHVYVGKDTIKWVELSYTFANGFKEGRWDLASTVITIPQGTGELFFRIQTDVASAYRLDDFKVEVSEEAGTSIDFSQGVVLDSDPTPDPGNTYKYKKVERITSGKAYLIVTTDGTVAAGPVPAGKSYGYLPKVEVNAVNGEITLSTDENEFTFTETQLPGSTSNDPVYTIKQKDGRYLYMKGTYTSCNVDTNPTEGQYWLVRSDATAAGATISNYSNNKWMQYSASHSSWGVYDSEQSGALRPELYERVDDGGGSGGGGDNPGGDETGDAIVWTIGSANQSWAEDTHDTYGTGFSASDNDIKVGYYKNTSTTTPVTANTDHIRVYKYSVLIITPTGGKKVKKVVMETTGANYTSNLNVLDPGSGTATASSTTITWTGTAVTPWVGYAANGQVRVKKITVELE